MIAFELVTPSIAFVATFVGWIGGYRFRDRRADLRVAALNESIAEMRRDVADARAIADEWRKQAARSSEIATRAVDAYAELVGAQPAGGGGAASYKDPPTVSESDKKTAKERREREEIETLLPKRPRDRRAAPVPQLIDRDEEDDDDDRD